MSDIENGGPDMAPKPPTLGSALALPGHSIDLHGGRDGLPNPPTLGSAPAKPGRSSEPVVP